MTVSSGSWHELDTERRAGTARRRLIPSSDHNLFLAVHHPAGQRMLTLGLAREEPVAQLSRAVDRLPTIAGMELGLAALSDGTRELQLGLVDTALSEVFDALASDVATAVATLPAGTTASAGFVERVTQWMNLLRSVSDSGLDDRRRRGMFGELHVLERLLHAGTLPDTAVSAWTAPDRTSQDFQLPKVAIEVKTSTSARGDMLHIASERQLDPEGTSTLLLTRLLVDERRGGDGRSLNTLIAGVRNLVTDSNSRGRFDQKLVRAGFLRHHSHRYDEPRYTVRSDTTWRVEQNFPRITVADLRPGVSDCAYTITVTGLDHLTITTAQFDELVRGRST